MGDEVVVSVARVEEAPSLEIGEMLADHGAVLLAAARLITLNETEAEDVVQVTFEIALRKGHTLRDPGSLPAWLLAIETREAVRRVRSMRRVLSFGPHVHEPQDRQVQLDRLVDHLRLRLQLDLLPDGRVLISAGNDGNGPIYSLEMYDPKAGKFGAAGTVGSKRGFYTANLLNDGRVLISGGYDTTAAKSAGYLATCELYDPATGKLSPTGSMAAGRLAHTATTLQDGRVLVAGGVGGGEPFNLDSAELYQP